MATEESIQRETGPTHAYRTKLDGYIGRVLNHHNAGRVVPSRDGVPDIQNVSGESFFHRNLSVPKNIQAHQYDIDISREAGRSIKLEGEVLVTFYDYLLDSGMFKYVVMPLQYLYKNYGQAMAPEGFPPMILPSSSRQDATDEHPLRVMEFPTCYYAKDFLKAFSSERIWNIGNRGDGLRPGVSFQLPLDSQQFTIAISISYLGVEKNIGPPTRSTQGHGASGGQDGPGLEVLERLEELTDFRKGPRLLWPRESLTLVQNKFPNVDYDNLPDDSVDKHFILVHRAGIILLNTDTGRGGDSGEKEALAIFRSSDDKNSGRVPLLPHQKSTNALDAFLNVLSNTLKSSEQAVLDNLRSKASNYLSGFQEFARESDTPKDFGGRLVSGSATLSGDLLAVIDVAKSQKRYIKDLQEFLARLSSGPNHPNGSLRVSSLSSEQRKMLLEKIHFILEERQTFLDEVNEIFSEVKAIEESFYRLSALRASQKAVTTSDGIRLAIRRHRKDTVVEMQRQGKRFRRAWWRRIIPSREGDLPPPADSDADRIAAN